MCTYGGKRIGGLFIADRSRFLARKVMKIAISTTAAAGVPKIQPPVASVGLKRVAGFVSAPITSRQQPLPYIMNIQGGAAAGGGGASVVTGSPATVAGLSRVSAIGTQHLIVQDAFKTDIQDFKGGIKFELGRNIHVLPSADSAGGIG